MNNNTGFADSFAAYSFYCPFPFDSCSVFVAVALYLYYLYYSCYFVLAEVPQTQSHQIRCCCSWQFVVSEFVALFLQRQRVRIHHQRSLQIESVEAALFETIETAQCSILQTDRYFAVESERVVVAEPV